MKKIDCYSHFSFPRLLKYLTDKSGSSHEFAQLFANTRPLIDPAARLVVMDQLGVERHVLIPLPELGMTPAVGNDPVLAAEAARIANDELAQVVAKFPERFSGVGMLPTCDPQVMVAELERAVCQLQLAGGVLGVGPDLKPPDHPDFDKLFAKAVELEAPLWIHPARSAAIADYIDEPGGSKYQFFQAFSWLLDSTLAMHRIVFSGVFERYPTLRVIIHHHGALIPYFVGRLEVGIQFFEKNAGRQYDAKVRPPYAEHYRKFYIDTATQYFNPAVLQIAVAFFGSEHTVFGSDAPMDMEGGLGMGRSADQSLAALQLNERQRRQIYFENAERLLKLT